MKTKTCLVLSLCLGVAAALPAQTLFSDSLATDASNWVVNPPNQGGGSTTFANSRLNYLVGTPTASDAGMRTLNVFAAPSTSSWNAQVDIHFANVLMGWTQYANLNLMVGKVGSEITNNATFSLDRYNAGAGQVQDIDTYVTTAGIKSHLTEVLNATTDATLMISYDHLTSMLTFAYDSDGPVGGPSFVTAHTANISGWSMLSSDNFAFLLIGASGQDTGAGPAIVSGDAYFQNFAVTAVPEPSTYAIILGTCSLGLVMLRRRFCRGN